LIAKFEKFTVSIESAERLNQEAVTISRNLEDSLGNVSNETKQ
jgi:hypothetical protein